MATKSSGAGGTFLKVANLLSIMAVGGHLFCFLIHGWGTAGRSISICSGSDACTTTWVIPTEICMILAFLCLLTAAILSVCVVCLDVMKGGKPALIAFIILEMIGGALVLLGVIIFLASVPLYTYSNVITIITGLIAILAAIFGILDIAGVKVK